MVNIAKEWRTVRVKALTLAAYCLGAACLYGQQPSSELSQITESLKAKDLSKAHLLCSSALKRSPKDPRLWSLDGIALLGLHQEQKSLEAFRTALRLSPDYRPALEGEAEILVARDDPAGLPVLQKLLTQIPNDALTLAMIGKLEFASGHFADAARLYARAPSVLAGRPDLLIEYGIALMNLGQFADAAQKLSQAIENRPDDPRLRFNLALAQWRAGDIHEASETLKPLLTEKADNADVHSLAACLLESQDDIPGAVEQLRSAIQLAPTDVENYLEFATLSYRYRSYKAGIELLNVGISEVPNSAPLYIARGTLYAQLSQFNEAFRDFDHANQLDPNQAFGTLAKGVASSQTQDPKAAVASYRVQAKLTPNEPLAHFLLAEALSEVESSSSPEGTTELLSEAQTATRLDGRMVAAHDLLAKVYLRLGRNQDSIAEANLALALQPNDEQALYSLLLASRKSGDRTAVNAIATRLAAAHEAAATSNEKRRNFQISIPAR